jgi:hypothetical protein
MRAEPRELPPIVPSGFKTNIVSPAVSFFPIRESTTVGVVPVGAVSQAASIATQAITEMKRIKTPPKMRLSIIMHEG